MKKLRLHHFISKSPDLRKEYTIGDIQNNIEQYGVLIDGEVSNNRLVWVYEGQKIELNNWPIRQKGDLSQIRIIADEPDFVVLFKPAGVVVHPGAGHQSGTLFDWILEHISGQKELLVAARHSEQSEESTTSNATQSAGLVHRLDKDTAGLIVVAKTLEAHSRLQNEFRERKVEKHYRAVLKGKLSDAIEVRGWQCRDKRNPRFQKFFVNEEEAKRYDPQARFSHSLFTPLVYSAEADQTLVDVEIFTGRMHQIRVQAKHLGHPVLNDFIYGGESKSTSTFLETKEFIEPTNMQLVSYLIVIGSKVFKLSD